jgi:hypothetical protein
LSRRWRNQQKQQKRRKQTMKPASYEFIGVWMNCGGTCQRADVVAIMPDGSRRHAFHQWITFPHFGKIMAAAIYRAAGDIEKAEKESADHEYYWMNGPLLDSPEAVMQHCAGLGNFRHEEDPYPPDSGPRWFPVALDYESAVALYERDLNADYNDYPADPDKVETERAI